MCTLLKDGRMRAMLIIEALLNGLRHATGLCVLNMTTDGSAASSCQQLPGCCLGVSSSITENECQ